MKFSIELAYAQACGIYKISNSLDGRLYVGSALNFKRRYNRHLTELRQGEHHCDPLQNFTKKYGEDTLTFSLIEVCTRENLLQREQYCIDALNAHCSKGGFNVCAIAGSRLGLTNSPEHIAAVASALRGNTFRRGATHTEEARAKISVARKLNPPPKAQLDAAREASRLVKSRRKNTPETIAKRLATRAARRAETPGYGLFSPEAKLKMSELKTEFYKERRKQPKCNPVITLAP